MRIYHANGTFKEVNKPTETYTKPNWYRRTERLLKSFKNLPYEIENLKLQLRLDQLAGPSITAKYKPVVTQLNSVSSPTESAVIKEETLEEKIERKEIWFKKLENTIKAFNTEEHQLYKLRYEYERGEKEAYLNLQMSRSSYFEFQKKVVLKAAKLLCIPVPEDDLPEEWKGKLFESVPYSEPV